MCDVITLRQHRERTLSRVTQIADTTLDAMTPLLFGFGLLTGTFYVALDTVIAPFAAYRSADVTFEKNSVIVADLPRSHFTVRADRN